MARPESGRPSGAAVARGLARVARRATWVGAAAGAAVGAGVGLVVWAGLWAAFGDGSWAGFWAGSWGWGWGTALPGVGALAGAVLAVGARRVADLTRAAQQVERQVPESRNVVRTAAELLEGRVQADPYVTEAVFRRAGQVLEGADPRQVIPARRPMMALGLALVAWVAAGAAAWSGAAGVGGVSGGGEPGPGAFFPTAPGEVAVEVRVVPPAYTGADAQVLHDPERIEALEGSRIEVAVEGAAGQVTLETVEGREPLELAPDGAFRGTVEALADGFVALEGARAEGQGRFRRLMGLTVRPDPAPRVRIVAPGRDLLIPDGDRTLELEVEASDEFGLASLQVVATKATGFGELFTFTDSEVPLEVTRESPTRWTARGTWSLRELELERGDVVVYHAQAHDRRPGAPPGTSETWMVEVAGSEAAAVGGFAGEDDMDRYALSQQMILVFTQRLMARRDSISSEEFTREAQTLAAAQRRVRAEFVFMLGGELEDDHDHDHVSDEAMAQLHEEAHAQADAAAAEGRLAQQGRIELTRAVQAMSHSAAFLAAVEMDDALAAQETALIFLQRAFSASRYILRAMTEREQLDFSRRLTGVLATAVPDRRPAASVPGDPGLAAVRGALAEVSALAGGAARTGAVEGAPAGEDAGAGAGEPGPETPLEGAGALAADVLRADPTAEALQRAAALLGQAADAADAGRNDEARARLVEAAEALAGWIRERVRPAPMEGGSLELRRLEGALSDALESVRGDGQTEPPPGGSP